MTFFIDKDGFYALHIGDMIDQVGSGWSVHIDNMEIRDLPLEDEREFRVRY